ncbi:hypothetical protein [Luteolibacter luteus]|uniref:Uncharacterized protein n=1 Tax=Luteolibacter luteus TaxID=2728835 RepID=A0A858RK91_9BACT|nr:hypothetical protein [Luteolibacter luteus]QJE96819.1 hypothetical protein HHL09_13845 [Luteolibacter luteus]
MFAVSRNLSAPQNFIFAGIVGCLVFGFLTFVEFSTPTFKPIGESEVRYFRGRAEHVTVAPMRYGGLNYRIWLEDQPVAFQQLKLSGDNQIDPAEFRAIQPGAEIVVGVETSKVDHPGVDRRLKQAFLSFVSLEAGQKAIGSLADYNAAKVASSKKGLFFPGMLALSIGMVGIGIAAGRVSTREEDHERAIRELVLRHQAEIAGDDPGFQPERPLREEKEA